MEDCIKSIIEGMDDLKQELETVQKGGRCKAAAARARKQTIVMQKLFKEFRRLSLGRGDRDEIGED